LVALTFKKASLNFNSNLGRVIKLIKIKTTDAYLVTNTPILFYTYLNVSTRENVNMLFKIKLQFF